ncbi:MAG TPA: hypothetical protein VLI67_10510 [Vicinamibacteria bacterium]|nr:hypothetical protein [Vicinamibacteria bacterium]
MQQAHRSGSARLLTLAATLALGLALATPVLAGDVTSPFAGKAVNRGTVTHEMVGGQHVLTLSADFEVPGSPDPHWQVVDSRGRTYLLDRIKLKDDRIKTSIALPPHVPDVAKVQMWCAWAEVVLGEASFPAPIMAHAK